MVESSKIEALVAQTLRDEFGLLLPTQISWDPFHEQWRVSVDLSHCKYDAYREAYPTLVQLLSLMTEDNFRIMDSDRIREQRLVQKHGKQEYDVALLHDFTQDKTKQARFFYQRLALAIRELGKTTFLPMDWFGTGDDERSKQWFADYDEGCKDCYTMTNHLALPSAKLVIADLGHVVGSEDIGVPLARAMSEGKPVVYIASTVYHFETVREVLSKIMIAGRQRQEDPDLLDRPYVTMHRKSFWMPLKRYPRIWEIIRYDTEDSAVTKLKTSVEKFFQANPYIASA
ncbi:hypothetical protein HY493_05600 [Candidatus Woesearchaeota archaeon]|nr:hypothetical protein [Candidatus Woesearchaeota archaeon]